MLSWWFLIALFCSSNLQLQLTHAECSINGNGTCSSGQISLNKVCITCAEAGLANLNGKCVNCRDLGKFYDEGQCVDLCPAGKFGSNGACVAFCPDGQATGPTGCVPCSFIYQTPGLGSFQCPYCWIFNNNKVYQDGACVDRCSAGRLPLLGQCYPCSFFKLYELDGVCDLCGFTSRLLEDGKCVDQCQDGYVGRSENCTACSSLNQVFQNKTCVSCSSQRKLYENGKCVEYCSTAGFSPTNGVCNDCKSKYLLYENKDGASQCVAQCSGGRHNFNGQCVFCQKEGQVYNDGQCLGQCPAGKANINGKCVDCKEFGYVYQDGECVSCASKNLLYIDGECRSECPADMIQPYGACLSCSSFDMIPFNGSCISCFSQGKLYNDGVCVEGQCPGGKVSFFSKCVDCAAVNQALENGVCVDCAASLKFLEDGKCVTGCSAPKGAFLGVCRNCSDLGLGYWEGHCVNCTALNMLIGNGRCVCPPGDAKENSPGYNPRYSQIFIPGYTPGYTPGYNPGYNPGYSPGYIPGYNPGYQHPYNPVTKTALQSDHINSLHACSPKYRPQCSSLSRFRKPDGTCNNLLYPWWGAAFTPYKRLERPAYQDSVKQPRSLSVLGQPLRNPRFIASTVHFSQDRSGALSHFFPIFGQYVMHDIARTGHSYGRDGQIKACPCGSQSSTCVNMPIPKNDRIRAGNNEPPCLVQVRERDSRKDFECDLGHREQINEATSWLDQSNTYGNDEQQEASLRSHKGGKLRAVRDLDDDNRRFTSFMPSKCRADRDFKLLVRAGVCFQTGDDRANENPLLAGVHTIFLREHNRLVDRLHALNPRWDDQRLYQEGRRVMNAIYQHIVYSEWLPVVLGEFFYQWFGLAPNRTSSSSNGEYSHGDGGYFIKHDPYISPNVAIEFATGAGRFGHALIRSHLSKADRKLTAFGSFSSMSGSLFKPDMLIDEGETSFNDIMRGCLRDLANKNGPHVTGDLLDYLVVDHGNHNPARYHSLPAININRAREVGLQPYNKYRRLAGLAYARSFEELTTWIEPHKMANLKRAYAHVDDIDLFAGAMSETPVEGGLVGPTFAYILARGFRDWKYGDRFYYENSPETSPHAFTPYQLNCIRATTFSSILCNTLDIAKVPVNAFLAPDPVTNPFILCRSTRQLDTYFFRDF